MTIANRPFSRLSLNLALTGLVLLLMTSCHHDNGPTALSQAVRTPQGFVELPFGRLPNTNINLEQAYQFREPLDADSIELWAYRGGLHYHPIELSHRCQVFIAAFYKTGDTALLERAERYARKIMALSKEIDDAVYPSFDFRFALHSDSSLMFNPVWFSGMAQGELMMVVVRLYEFTGKTVYLDFAHKLFRGFLRLRRDHDSWVVRLDSLGFYWIEEYPHNTTPGMTLNGFIAAVYGVYDYYRITRSDEARMIYEMSLTTIKHYLPYFRQKNKASFYCLGHMKPATESYHALHVSMMRHLYRMTDDPFFEMSAETLEADGVAAFDKPSP